jgi:hypothetical protein
LTYLLGAIETITVAPGSARSKASAKIARSSGLAATIEVAASSSGIATVNKTEPLQDAAQKKARRGHGWPGGREGGRMPQKNSRQGPWMALPA